MWSKGLKCCAVAIWQQLLRGAKVVVCICFSVAAFIACWLVFVEDPTEILALYWFVVAFICAFMPFIEYFEFKEFKAQMSQTAQKLQSTMENVDQLTASEDGGEKIDENVEFTPLQEDLILALSDISQWQRRSRRGLFGQLKRKNKNLEYGDMVDQLNGLADKGFVEKITALLDQVKWYSVTASGIAIQKKAKRKPKR